MRDLTTARSDDDVGRSSYASRGLGAPVHGIAVAD